MTREEEVKHAAYAQYCNSESICFTLLCNSFKQGAEWADNNPKSPWISVDDDLPCNHPELLHNNYTTKYVLALDNGYPNVKYMSKLSDGNWYWLYAANVTHWMPIPKLENYNNN